MAISAAQHSGDQRDLKPARYSVANREVAAGTSNNMQRHPSQEHVDDANSFQDPTFLAGYLAGLQAANASKAPSASHASASQFATEIATPWNALLNSSGATDLTIGPHDQALYRSGSVHSDGTAHSPFSGPGYRLGTCINLDFDWALRPCP
jgi:hypothetical protein